MIWLWPLAAAADEDREEEMFGSADDVDEAALFGEGTTDEDIFETLKTADERYTLGGRMWLRLDGSKDQGVDALGLRSPSFVDLFGDARPNDRLRGHMNVRTTHDWTVTDGDLDAFGNEAQQTSVILDQMWLKVDAWKKVYLTLGQQRIRWGAGRFWNPTDFMNAQRLDPLAVFDQRTGVALVKAHVPVGSTNLYALANLDDAAELGSVGGALRAEVLVGLTELSLSAALRKDSPTMLGADLSTGIGLFDFRLEGAVQNGVTTTFYEGELDLETFTFPDEVDRSEEWIPQLVAGADVTFRIGDEDTLTLGLEGFYNDAGYADADLLPVLFFSGTYVPFYVGREYVSGFAFLPGPGRWDELTLTSSWIANLSDQSHVGRIDASVLVLTEMVVNGYFSHAFGDQGEFRYALDLPAVPGVLEDGLSIAAPRWDAGLGARISF